MGKDIEKLEQLWFLKQPIDLEYYQYIFLAWKKKIYSKIYLFEFDNLEKLVQNELTFLNEFLYIKDSAIKSLSNEFTIEELEKINNIFVNSKKSPESIIIIDTIKWAIKQLTDIIKDIKTQTKVFQSLFSFTLLNFNADKPTGKIAIYDDNNVIWLDYLFFPININNKKLTGLKISNKIEEIYNKNTGPESRKFHNLFLVKRNDNNQFPYEEFVLPMVKRKLHENYKLI